MTDTRIMIHVPGIPLAFARPASNGKFRYTPAPQRKKMQMIEMVAAEAMRGRKPLEGPVSASIRCYWPWPKSMSKKKRQAYGAKFRASKPDADNAAKLTLDALNGIAYVDDSQVVDLVVMKRYSDEPGTSVTIEALTEEPAP